MCEIFIPVFVQIHLHTIYNVVMAVTLLYNLSCIIVIFFKHFRLRSVVTTHILRNQFIFDFLVVLILLIYLNTEYVASSNTIFNQILCHLWNSRFIFWILINFSVNNLTINCIDRVIAVRWAVSYKTTTKLRLYTYYVWSIMVSTTLGGFTISEVKIINNICIDSLVNATGAYLNLGKFTNGMWLGVAFVIPMIAMLASFIMIYVTLRNCAKNGSNMFLRKSEIRYIIVTFSTFIILLLSHGIINVLYVLKVNSVICFREKNSFFPTILAISSLLNMTNSFMFNFTIKDLGVLWMTFWGDHLRKIFCTNIIDLQRVISVNH